METLSDDIVLLFKKGGNSLSVGEILQKLGVDVLIGLIDVIRNVVVGLIAEGALILQDLKTFNYKINIPIFSVLYKKFISGGTDLTVLDGLSMLLTIPITIFGKLMTGKALPDMTSLNYGALVDGKITDPTQLQNINEFMNLMAWNTNSLKGVVEAFAASAPTEFGDTQETNSEPLSNVSSTAKHQRPRHGHHGRHQHHLERLLQQHALEQGIDNPIAMDWRLGLGVTAKLAALPTDPKQPGYPIRWIGWLLGFSNVLIRATIRKKYGRRRANGDTN
jgi:hypothetical protein